MSEQTAARKKIRNEFGLTVATKASDAFVQLYAAAADAPFGLESFGIAGAPPRVPTILEMSVRTPDTPFEKVSSTRFRAAQRAAAEALDQLGFDDAPLAAVRALRRQAVERVRDAFLTECGGVLDELERATAGRSARSANR